MSSAGISFVCKLKPQEEDTKGFVQDSEGIWKPRDTDIDDDVPTLVHLARTTEARTVGSLLEIPARTYYLEYWRYKGELYDDKGPIEDDDEIRLHVKYAWLRRHKQLDRIKREVAAFENRERLPSARRESIPKEVRLFVWQRDEGKCVECGSNAKLEYDHIIPVAEGGSSTERNIQLLCESCNRSKGKKI